MKLFLLDSVLFTRFYSWVEPEDVSIRDYRAQAVPTNRVTAASYNRLANLGLMEVREYDKKSAYFVGDKIINSTIKGLQFWSSISIKKNGLR
jgi:hypothetical protein